MPNRDYTGPNGQGPRTGRAMGRCRAGASAGEETSNNSWGESFGSGRGQCWRNGQGCGNGRGRGRRWGFGSWSSGVDRTREEPVSRSVGAPVGLESDRADARDLLKQMEELRAELLRVEAQVIAQKRDRS